MVWILMQITAPVNYVQTTETLWSSPYPGLAYVDASRVQSWFCALLPLHATKRPYDVRIWQAQGMCYQEMSRYVFVASVSQSPSPSLHCAHAPCTYSPDVAIADLVSFIILCGSLFL